MTKFDLFETLKTISSSNSEFNLFKVLECFIPQYDLLLIKFNKIYCYSYQLTCPPEVNGRLAETTKTTLEIILPTDIVMLHSQCLRSCSKTNSRHQGPHSRNRLYPVYPVLKLAYTEYTRIVG